MADELLSVSEEIEWGLRTPNGRVVWPPESYRGYPINTAEDRNSMIQILHGCALELDLDPDGFVGGFAWVPRSKMTVVISRDSGQLVDIATQWPVEQPEPDPNE